MEVVNTGKQRVMLIGPVPKGGGPTEVVDLLPGVPVKVPAWVKSHPALIEKGRDGKPVLQVT